MNPADFSTNNPKEAIIDFLRNFASYELQKAPDLQTVQFLGMCSIPTHQLHDVAFRYTNGQAQRFRFLLIAKLCRSTP